MKHRKLFYFVTSLMLVSTLAVAFRACALESDNPRDLDSVIWKQSARQHGDTPRIQMIMAAKDAAKKCKTKADVRKLLGNPDRIDAHPIDPEMAKSLRIPSKKSKNISVWSYWCGSVTSGSSEYFGELRISFDKDDHRVDVWVGG